MNSLNSIALAEFILASYPGKKITPMKLQKLSYYSKVWSLVANTPFIDADFEKWDYGPVNCAIYANYKQYGSNVIPQPLDVSSPTISAAQEDLIKFILNNYINQSAYALSAATHSETPWQETPPNQVITDKAIIDYYSKQPFAKNFTDQALKTGIFHVLQSNSWHSFTLDMTPKEAMACETYESFDAFQNQAQKAEHDFDHFINTIFH